MWLKIFILLLSLVANSSAHADFLVAADDSAPRCEKGHDGPYPWGTEIDFPWDRVNGFWRANFGPYSYYFYFKVVTKTDSANQYLWIREFAYDESTKEYVLVATGGGYEDNRVLYGMVIGSRFEHFLVIRAYTNEATNQQDTVITIPNLPKIGHKEPNAIMEKVL